MHELSHLLSLSGADAGVPATERAPNLTLPRDRNQHDFLFALTRG